MEMPGRGKRGNQTAVSTLSTALGNRNGSDFHVSTAPTTVFLPRFARTQRRLRLRILDESDHLGENRKASVASLRGP